MAKFTISYNMNKRGITTLFKHKLFTIDADVHKNWDYSQLESYLVKYKLCIAKAVLDNMEKSNPIVADLLKEMLEQDSYFTIKKNKGQRYGGDKQYIKCQVPIYVLDYLKKFFVSTIVYSANNSEMPEEEKIIFEFDNLNINNEATVTIIDMKLYEPINNPYFIYARNAVSTLSVEAIGLEQYNVSNDNKIKDFYNWDKISKWKESEKFFTKVNGKIIEKMDKNGLLVENSINGQPGVYMLYDENRNEFYVGKAKNLRSRILDHARNIDGKDPIPDFTHYRYSVINLEYLQFLYLIENACIHDCAWILEMENAQKIKPALSQKTKKSLKDCKMVNTLERQRKTEL